MVVSSPNHYMAVDEISGEQRAKIDELRSRVEADLKEMPEYGDDFSLLRWLLGWDFNIDVIVPKLRYSLRVFRALRLHEIDLSSIDKVNEYVSSVSHVSDYYPGGLMGQDREGNVIIVEPLARTHPKSLVRSGKVTDLFRSSVAESEGAFRIVRQEERKQKRKLGVIIVIDLDGFSMDLLYMPTLMVYKNLLTLLQELFPDFARHVYVINSPMVIKQVYALIKPVLSKQSREKVEFLGKDWQEKLHNELGKENIFAHWGGTKPHTKPMGSIRAGGEVPEHLSYAIYCKDKHVIDADLKSLNVGARSSEKVSVIVDEPGSIIHWHFLCSSGDIDFTIVHNGIEVSPMFRTMTEFVPEYGELSCQSAGTYTFIFGNGHGMIFGKEIKYAIGIR